MINNPQVNEKMILMKNKFKENDYVYIPKYKKNGTIVDVCRYFKEVNPITNEFENDGHAIMENTLIDFRIPYELDGDILTVDRGEGYLALNIPSKMKYKAQSILCTVEIPSFGSVVVFENELSRG
jgi:hypothetical protein